MNFNPMFRLQMWIYQVLYTLGVLLYSPYYLYRRFIQRKLAAALRERIALPARPDAGEPGQESATRLWIHAVSVGEVNAIRPLVERLDQQSVRLMISTTTETGQSLAKDLFSGRARVFYFPMDWRWTCRRFLQVLRPDLVVFVETELWPGFISSAHNMKIPLVLVNGRISDRSFPRYRRIRFFLAPLLSRIDKLCMQSQQDRERVLELGASPESVHWIGNLKFDYALSEASEKLGVVSEITSLLKPKAESLLWVCGSTREGEEALLLPVLKGLRREFPELRMLLAPRHPHRGEEIARLVELEGLGVLRRSRWAPRGQGPIPDVMVLDSIGELSYLYEASDVVFVGGSLVPWGGHNIIEAAWFGKAILFGPHMHNFREISAVFLERFAALQVNSPEELEDRLRKLLQDSSSREWLGRNARKVLRDHRGAVDRTLEVMSQFFKTSGRSDHQHALPLG